MRNASGHQGKNKGAVKKSEQEHIYLGSFWKFYVVVAQKQRQRNVQKSVLQVQSCFLLIRLITFFPFLFPSSLSITQFYILFE